MKVVELARNDFKGFVKLFQQSLIDLNGSIYPETIKEDLIQGFSFQHLLMLYNRLDSLFYLAKDQQKIIGFIFGWFEHGIFWVDWVGVIPQYRSKGVGTLLFDTLTNFCREQKCHKIVFNTITKNSRAIDLYQRIGFKVEALFKNHWYKEDWSYLSKEL